MIVTCSPYGLVVRLWWLPHPLPGWGMGNERGHEILLSHPASKKLIMVATSSKYDQVVHL